MKNIKSFKLFEGINFINKDQFKEFLKKIEGLRNDDFYVSSELSNFKDLKSVNFDDLETFIKKASDVLDLDRKSFNIFWKESFSLTFISVNDEIRIRMRVNSLEDEWYKVIINIIEYGNIHHYPISYNFYCDQKEGFFAFLVDLKKIIDEL